MKILQFDHSKGKDEYTVGSNKDSFIILEATPDASLTHATIKKIEGYVNVEESKKPCKSNERFASHEGIFRVSNSAQYGTLIFSRRTFLIPPQTMELFQFGNLMVQISRY